MNIKKGFHIKRRGRRSRINRKKEIVGDHTMGFQTEATTIKMEKKWDSHNQTKKNTKLIQQTKHSDGIQTE